MKEQIEKRNTLLKRVLKPHGLLTTKDLPVFNLDDVIKRAVKRGYKLSPALFKRRITESKPTPLELAKRHNLTHLAVTSVELRAVAGVLSELGLSSMNAANALLSEAEKLEEGN